MVVSEKDKTRAIRRHHTDRLKASRNGFWGNNTQTDRQLGIVAQTPAVCSCWMCGNPRKFFSELTMQEKKFKQTDGWED